MKRQHARDRGGGVCGAAGVLQAFEGSEVAELPPRLRALFEDNKARRTRRGRAHLGRY